MSRSALLLVCGVRVIRRQACRGPPEGQRTMTTRARLERKHAYSRIRTLLFDRVSVYFIYVEVGAPRVAHVSIIIR